MELDNKYLTYDEYMEIGGTLDETPFNILEFEAQKEIDKYTFGRLKDLDEQINEVKMCVYALMSILNTYSAMNNAQAKGLTSESIDGYSVSYGQASESIVKSKSENVKSIIKTYLSDCKLEDGTPYLYVGADANVK